MVNKHTDNMPIFHEYLHDSLKKIIWVEFFYRFIFILLLFLTIFNLFRISTYFFDTKKVTIFFFNFILLNIFFFSLTISFFGNFSGKILRKIDIKSMYETKLSLEKKNIEKAKLISKSLEDHISKTNYTIYKPQKNWKIVFVIFLIFFLIFSAGNLYSYFQFGKVALSPLSYEEKVISTMQSKVLKMLAELSDNSEQYKTLKSIYESYTKSFESGGIDSTEYLKALDQLMKGLSMQSSYQQKGMMEQNNQYAGNEKTNINTNKPSEENSSLALYSKLKNEMIENENNMESNPKSSKEAEFSKSSQQKQSFIEFLKSEFINQPKNAQNMLPGYSKDNITSSSENSLDFTTIMESIFSSNNSESYSLSNQLTSEEKLAVFKYFLQQYSLKGGDINFDEAYFISLIKQYLQMIEDVK